MYNIKLKMTEDCWGPEKKNTHIPIPIPIPILIPINSFRQITLNEIEEEAVKTREEAEIQDEAIEITKIKAESGTSITKIRAATEISIAEIILREEAEIVEAIVKIKKATETSITKIRTSINTSIATIQAREEAEIAAIIEKQITKPIVSSIYAIVQTVHKEVYFSGRQQNRLYDSLEEAKAEIDICNKSWDETIAKDPTYDIWLRFTGKPRIVKLEEIV